MLLERTIVQLDTGPVPPDEARQMGHLGYLQWLAGLARDSDYRWNARRAHDMAAPFMRTSPAVAEFCAVLLRSLEAPLEPLALSLPPRKRRGGADARRE